MPANLTFGQRLRFARRAAGLSIEEAASLFNRSSRLWKFWEADQRIPPVQEDVITQEKLFETLGRAERINEYDTALAEKEKRHEQGTRKN